MFSVQYHFPSPSCQALRAMPRSRRKFRHLLLILVKVWSLEITHTHRHVLMANNEQKLMLFSSHTIHLHTKRKGRRIDFSEASYLSVQFSSVAQSCPTRCDPMNHSMPGLPVHHQLPEFTQTHALGSLELCWWPQGASQGASEKSLRAATKTQYRQK